MTDRLRAAAQAILDSWDSGHFFTTGHADRIGSLRAALAEMQADWSMLEAAKESLREHMAEIRRLRAAAEAALEAMNRLHGEVIDDGYAVDLTREITALEAALAEQDAEPVAKYSDIVSDGGMDPRNKFDQPPRREWVGLTDEEINRVTDAQWARNNDKPIYAAYRAYARAIEQALKEKNHG